MYSTSRTPQQGAHEHTPAQQNHWVGRKAKAIVGIRRYGENKAVGYPPSVQNDLVKGYLNPHQEAIIRPILRILKKKYQEELCTALMDYMETGVPVVPDNITLGGLFMRLTRVGLSDYDDSGDKSVIRPLHSSNNNF